MSGCRYIPEGNGYGVRFTLPDKDNWNVDALREIGDWLTDEFGDPHIERWYRIQWVIHIPDPTIAMMFRLRWC